MQTISIAVSAILIAAGLITAPSLINNARDMNAKQDLANIAIAQNWSLSNDGNYSDSLPILQTNPAVKFTTSATSTDIRLIAGSIPDSCYVAFVQSASGTVFYRSSGSSATYRVPVPWPNTAPSDYPAGCSWPMSASAATAQIITNLDTQRLGTGFNAGSVTGSTLSDTGIDGTTYNRATVTSASTQSNWGPYETSMVSGTVNATTEYQASAWIRVSHAQKFAMGAELMNASNSPIGPTLFGNVTSLLPGVWTRLSVLIPQTPGLSRVNLTAYGAESIATNVGDTVDYEGFMLTAGPILYDYADGNTPGWKWNGAMGASSSTGLPYTLDGIAGNPVIDASNPAKGTQFDYLFTTGHTSISLVDTTTSGQLGWLASDNLSAARWEVLNMSTSAKAYWYRTQGVGGPGGGISSPGPLPGLDIVTAGWAPDGTISMSVRGGTPASMSALQPSASGYHLIAGVRDTSPSWGVAPARLLVYPGTLADSTRLAIVHWLANHYGIQM